MKTLFWIGNSRLALRGFPAKARRVAGFQIWRVQLGLDPNDWKPMPTVGPGVKEIRIRTGLEHRVIYTTNFTEGVYILHGFEKRTRKTAKRDIQIAKERLSRLLAERRRRKE